MTDQDREMIQFARSYHQAFVDRAEGELRDPDRMNILFKNGEITLTQRDGYIQAIHFMRHEPIEIAANDE